MNFFTNDAYQLSMLYAHWARPRPSVRATSEAYFRKFNRQSDVGMVVMAGAYRINHLIHSPEFKQPFAPSDMELVQSILRVPAEPFAHFASYLLNEFPAELAALKIRYARDGEPLYPDFPAVQVTGSVGAGHMVETLILGILNRSVRAATIARRIRHAAGGSNVKLLDFSTRRDDPDAAVHTGVAAFIGGFNGTSNMEAGRLYGIPVSGTMAHAYVLSFGMQGEMQAFMDFLHAFPNTHCLLVDTFDIQKGIANAIRASLTTGIPLRAIRIDSGNPLQTVPAARNLLDLMGQRETRIVVSGDFDEDLVSKTRGLPIDVIGIGSRLGSPDWSMGFVYKLVEIAGAPVMKLAGAKSSLPGKKRWIASPSGNRLELESESVGSACGDDVLVRDCGAPIQADLLYFERSRELTRLRLLAIPSACDTAQPRRLAENLCK